MSELLWTLWRVVGLLRLAPSPLLLLLLLLVVAGPLVGGDLVAQESAVVSFEAAAPGEADEAETRQLSFRFRFAPWEEVLAKFAEVSGLTLDLTDVPTGTFSYYDRGRYSPREALDILNGYLLRRGFVLVRRDRFLVCVGLEKGIPANLIPIVSVDQLGDYGDNELVSVVFAPEDMDASLAASQIGQLQGPHGAVVSLNASNSLLVTDTGSNLRLIERLLESGAFRPPVRRSTAPSFKSFALAHVRADEVERLIRAMFGLPPAGSSSEAKPLADRPGAPALTMTSDARTNRLFVTAAREALDSIEQIVADYDVATPTSDPRSRRWGARTTQIVPLPGADVVIIGSALRALSPRIRVSSTRSERPAAVPEPTPHESSPDEAGGERPVTPAARSENPDGRER